MVSSVRVKVTSVTDASLHHSSSSHRSRSQDAKTPSSTKDQLKYEDTNISSPNWYQYIHNRLNNIGCLDSQHNHWIPSRNYLSLSYIGLIYSQLIWCKLNVVIWLLRNARWQQQHDPMVMRPPSPVSRCPPTLQLRSWYAPCYVLLLSIIHIQTAS